MKNEKKKEKRKYKSIGKQFSWKREKEREEFSIKEYIHEMARNESKLGSPPVSRKRRKI